MIFDRGRKHVLSHGSLNLEHYCWLEKKWWLLFSLKPSPDLYQFEVGAHCSFENQFLRFKSDWDRFVIFGRSSMRSALMYTNSWMKLLK